MQRLTNLITNTMDDMFLLQLIKNGDKQAFKYVFDTYFTVLCRFMYLYLGDTQEAEDIASDIFASVWENRKNLKSGLLSKLIFSGCQKQVSERYTGQKGYYLTGRHQRTGHSASKHHRFTGNRRTE